MKIATALLVAAASAAAPFAAPAGARPAPVAYDVVPAPGSSLSARGDYFAVKGEPGEELTESLLLENDSRRAITLRLSAVDALSGQFGGVSYGSHSRPPTRVGAWIALDARSIRIGPQSSRRVRFTISIPEAARPGEHLAGIAVWSPADVKQQTPRPGSATQARASIVVTTRRVVAVAVRLPGIAERRLAVTGVRPIARPDGTYLEIGLANRGSALTKATGRVSLPDERFERAFSVDTFVPGTTIAYPVKWQQRPAEGEYDAKVELRYDGRTVSWDGSFTVGDALAGELTDRGATRGREPDESSSRSVPRVALAAAALALVAALVWLLRRRRARTAASAAQRGDAHELAILRERLRAYEAGATRSPDGAAHPPAADR